MSEIQEQVEQFVDYYSRIRGTKEKMDVDLSALICLVVEECVERYVFIVSRTTFHKTVVQI